METKNTSIRIPHAMVIRMKKDSESLGISLSQLIIEILDAQLNGKKFSYAEFKAKNTFKRKG